MNRLEELKKEYEKIEIPDELNIVVTRSIKERKKKMKKNVLVSAAASILVFVGLLNVSPGFAAALEEIPVVKNIVKVLVVKEYKVDEPTFDADIKVPAIEGLEDQGLQSALNEKYLDENKELYEKFIKDINEIKEKGGGNLGLDSGFIVKTDTDEIFSIGRYVVESAGSSKETINYDTIDRKKEVLITLPSLFKDETYIDIITSNINEQMESLNKELVAEGNNPSYYLLGDEDSVGEKIDKEQNYYINSDNKLVIAFQEYEVAAGYLGTVEFEIPTEILQESLVGNDYIK